jgi:dienelactone hydrolase
MLGLALLLIALPWWRVLSARSGLMVRTEERDGVPLRFIAPKAASGMPGVLIAHGFGGSQQVMFGFAHTLAHAGYGVVLWDFDGHAASANSLSRDANVLQRNLDVAYDWLAAQPEVDASRIALLGHSMGSGVVMRAGIRDVERYQATIAVSPTAAEVTEEAPHNLLLLVGAWEPQFMENADELLARAGGPNGAFDQGGARALEQIPGAEHILIVFSRTAHAATVHWLDQVFGTQQASSYQDRRLLWYGASLLGWMLLAVAANPLLVGPGAQARRSERRHARSWLGLLWAPFAAAVMLALIDRLAPVSGLGGLLVGGALGLWFLIMGVMWLAAGYRPRQITPAAIGRGVALFLFLWIAVGALAQQVWLPWLLIPQRLVRWPLMAAAYLPWLLASGRAQAGVSPGRRAAWWSAQSLLIAVGLVFAVSLVPGLGVLTLVLPLLPLIFGVMSIAGAAVDDPWAYAIGNSMFFGWTMMGYFPIGG